MHPDDSTANPKMTCLDIHLDLDMQTLQIDLTMSNHRTSSLTLDNVHPNAAVITALRFLAASEIREAALKITQ